MRRSHRPARCGVLLDGSGVRLDWGSVRPGTDDRGVRVAAAASGDHAERCRCDAGSRCSPHRGPPAGFRPVSVDVMGSSRPLTILAASVVMASACAASGSAAQAHGATTSTTRSRAHDVAAASAQRRLIDQLAGVHDARQVIAVTAAGYGTSYATLRVFRRTAHGWRRTFGPWPARIGRSGFAPRGQKREGDGRTPTGSFHFQFMFGVNADPGVRYHYRRAVRTSWWDDDSQSANYNLWVDSRHGDPGRNPESMFQTPAYDYAAVIGYNLSRTPGRGSAIFLHVSHNSATAGCVSIAQSRLLKVLRWLRPGLKPRIVMGTRS